MYSIIINCYSLLQPHHSTKDCTVQTSRGISCSSRMPTARNAFISSKNMPIINKVKSTFAYLLLLSRHQQSLPLQQKLFYCMLRCIRHTHYNCQDTSPSVQLFVANNQMIINKSPIDRFQFRRLTINWFRFYFIRGEVTERHNYY